MPLAGSVACGEFVESACGWTVGAVGSVGVSDAGVSAGVGTASGWDSGAGVGSGEVSEIGSAAG
ncbi:MAG: hypothetical protein AAB899_00610, partial [Patescibacteria group bacterium]